ncbi:GNAT family N-acetyltransferase [Abyssisolibacter fermentans]|uniref:GNAT family N-acetyltransferase n=1 Tax=Abyssisolibacter fermentans TaxID=1766203 RepID=UPI0008337682|nr:GNAT family N-acetyltransferase [Abyssisolibacter fermentans]
MEVRRLNIGDAEKVIDMLENFRSEKITGDNAIKFLNDKKNYLVACLNDDKIVGFILGYELQRYDNQNNMMYVHEVDVLSEYRRQGIGKKIMYELKQICKRKNLCKMFLITRKSNIPAINLYKTTKGKSSNDDDIVFWYESESF